MRGGIRRDVGRIDDEYMVEFLCLGLARILDIPADIDAGIGGKSGVQPVVLTGADAAENGA